MIKKLSLLTLLMALFVPWAANAQTTVEIGDGTSTTYYIPYNSLYNYSFVEQIYTADEIGMAGTINSIAFNLSSSDASQTNNFVVYMKNVQRSSFSSDTDYETVTSADIVFSDSFTFNAGWSTLTLTTPFEYDGSSNLLIAFDENSSGYNSRHFYYTSTTNNTVIDHYSDSYNPDPYNLSSYSGYKAVRTSRANIQLNITPDANYCAKPTLNPAEYIEEEQASISWTENGTATNWVLQYSTSSNFSNATSVNRNGIPAMVISDLSPATAYYVRVKANCGGENESSWSNVISFTTSCGAITSLPWSENFNNYSATSTGTTTATNYPNDVLPICWRFLNRSESSGSYPQVFLSSSSTYAVSGNCLFFKSSSSTPLYAILPTFNNDIASLMLSFTYRNEGTTDYNGTLYVSYMTDPTDASTFNEANAVACNRTTTKTPMEVMFSNAPAGSYFAFKYQGGSSNNYYLAIDDVTVKAPAIITANQIVNTVTDPATQMTWAEFAQHVSNGDHFTSTTFTLMEDITITSQANQAGADGNYFSGTFEGNGKTITVDMTATGNYCAPFYAVKNATINDLVVTGSITSDQYVNVGGLCGGVYGDCTFTNCVSNVNITSTASNSGTDGTCGGFAGRAGGGDNPTFVGCAFTGSISATGNNSAGFIGFHASMGTYWSGNYNGRSTYTNCLFAPSSINISSSKTAVFTAGYEENGQHLQITVTNSYYNEEGAEMNLKQNGKQAYSVTAQSPATVAMNGTPTSYSVSGIDAYNPGIVYNGDIYAGSGDNLSISLNGSSSGVYEADHGTLTADGDNFTLTMEAYNTEISGVNCPVPYNVTVNNVDAHSAQITWTGNSDSYTLQYREVITAPVDEDVTYDFEDGTLQGWASYDEDGDGYGWTNVTTAHGGSRGLQARYNSSAVPNNWLISPQISLGGSLSFYAKGNSSGTTERFKVYISTTGTDISNFTAISEEITAPSSYTLYEYDLSSYSGNGYVAIKHTAEADQYWLYVDDITFTNHIAGEYGEWQTVNNAVSPQALGSLTPETTYQVKVSGTCSGVETGYSDAVEFTTPVSCYVPTDVALTEGSVTAHAATITWTENGEATSWIVEYADNADFTDALAETVEDETTYSLEGLNGETTYYVRVKAHCGEGDESRYSDVVNFTTLVACPAPTDVIVSGITGHEAMVTWVGSSDSYIVKYRTAAYMDGIEEGFDSGNLPSGWENKTGLLSNVMGGTALSDSYQWYFGNNNGVFDYHARINIYGTSRYGWLITPEINVGDGFGISFDLALTAYSGTGAASGTCDDDRFVVLVYADNAWHILREWNNSGSSYVFNNIPTAGQNVSIDLSSYAGKAVRIAFYGESTTGSNGDNNLHIDNVTIGLPIAAGEWQTITTEEASVTLTSLIPETLYEVVVQGDCGEDGLSDESEPVTFTTEVACPAPVNLIVSDIYAHGATVSWEKMATQATGDITYNFTWVEHGGTPDWTLHSGMSAFDRWTNEAGPHAFAFGLEPETEYDFYVRRDCDEEGYSVEVMVTFTTTIACPAPADVTVSDITGHEATVTWTGHSENYVVEVGNYDYTATPTTGIIQEEDFEGGRMPAGWTHIGNGSVNMYSYSSHVHGGTYSLQFSGTTSDNVLVLPQFPARPNSLQISFWSQAEGSSSGSFDIGYVTDASDASSFVAIQSYSYSQHSSYQYVENIEMSTAPANARIAFRHRSGATNWYWYIDDITINGPVYPLVWNEYTTDNPTYTFEGLTPETTYFVSVQGDCGDEGMSAMSDTISFTTDISCPAPTPLEATDITSNSAVLHWTGDAESYNVSYYKAYFFESFEEDLSQWTIYKEGDEASMEWGIENPNDNTADLNAHSGDYAAVSYSDTNVHADSWLVSPQIQFPNQSTLKFWIMRYTYDDTLDEYEVRLSTTGNAIEDFDVVLKEKVAANPAWTEVVIDLSEYDGQQGYIAIRHDFTGGFFLMVDDFGIYGWSEPIATNDNSLLIEDLLPETEYLWQVQANCGEEDGLSQWAIGNFTTLKACPVPFDLNVSEITANGATIAWTGYSESYNVWVGQLEMATINYDFEDNAISADFTNDATYPWTVVANNHSGSYCAKSGNALIGANSTTSEMKLEVELESDGTLSFSGKVSSESGWDKAYFSIDGVVQSDFNGISGDGDWIDYEYPLATGTHTLRWYYTKDSSNDRYDDCLYVDDITIESDAVSSEMNYTATESPLLLNDATNILPGTTYLVKVKGICDDEETEYSEAVTFITLDESTKIFVLEGDWNDGDNWVPVGVPTIDDDVILRAEATVFDVAEANTIAIDETGALIIEDGGQLKTNADVEATMKKFIIGYGTDYVETNNGYYLMTLPTAAPVAAADAGLITEESDYDLYSWDRTATDEEWQNNHDGIDLQNGIGFLYANRDDMEMNFTATLRNSNEPVVVTPAYDEVEHGGWNLCGNPFPCEAYISTDAEGMTFYRLIDNELVPIEGAIAPLEAFFVKATAAGQTFTISREATRE